MNKEIKADCTNECPTFGKPHVVCSAFSGSVVSEVYLMDCIDLMKHYPDKYFDLAVVDPPYGTIEIFNQSKRKEYKNVEPDFEYFVELFRVSKNQIIWGANYLKKYELKGGMIVWNKLGKDIGRRNQAPTLSDAEIAYHSLNNLVKTYSYTWLGNVVGHNYAINPPEFKERIHISQKPISLYDFCFQFAKVEAGAKILDTHLGSGSSRISANKNKLHFVGCEIDAEYFEKQEKRYKDFVSQTRLF